MATPAKATISNLTAVASAYRDNGTNMAISQPTELSPVSGPMPTQALLGMRGWLLKRKTGVYDKNGNHRSGLMGIFGDFNKRFFWLDPSIRLVYYSESEDKSKRVSFIPFNKIVSVTPVTDPLAINSARTGWVYGIELETVDRVYELWARTSSEAKQWLLVLEKAASIGKAASSHYSGSIHSSTAYKLEPLQPPTGATISRRVSANSSQNEDTVPIVPTVVKKIATSPMSDNVTVDAGIRSPTMKVAPGKWDDWDK